MKKLILTTVLLIGATSINTADAGTFIYKSGNHYPHYKETYAHKPWYTPYRAAKRHYHKHHRNHYAHGYRYCPKTKRYYRPKPVFGLLKAFTHALKH